MGENQASSVFLFNGPIIDMEALGDVNGDGVHDLLAYHQNTIATDISHHVFLTSQEGYARVEVTQFDHEYATSELDLNGDYLPAGDWDGDGLDDFLLHRLDRDSVEVFLPRDGLSMAQPYRHIEAGCRTVFGGVASPEGDLMACLTDEAIALYGSDGTVWYVVQGPTGATLKNWLLSATSMVACLFYTLLRMQRRPLH